MKEWKFSLDAEVTISCSGEMGTIIGRAEYTAAENYYFVRYRAADGRAVEAWWPESALS